MISGEISSLSDMPLKFAGKTRLLGIAASPVLVLLPLLLLAKSAQKRTLKSTLDRLDAGARDFRTLTANVEHIKYTDVVKDTATESGQMWLQKKDEKMRIEFAKPDQRTILRSGNSLAI